MSVIFQLFCAEDLQKLTMDQLKELSDIVGTELRKHTQTPPRPAPLVLSLKVSDNTDPPVGTPEKAKAALNKRFHEVSHQLESPQLQPSQPIYTFDQLKAARKSPANIEKEEMLLQWAITCEVENFAFYLPLLRAKEVAHAFFEQKIKENIAAKYEPVPDKVRILPPDSPYSPLNPRHPLYRLYGDLKL
jgi:hypothetical protein